MRRLTEKLPGIGGVIKSVPADFLVDELLPFEPTGLGSHTYTKIEKINMTTFEAIDRIAGALGLDKNQIGFAGMKDRNAITRQFLSIPLPPEKILPLNLANLRILSAVPHRHKLRRGLVKENSFDIRIRDVSTVALDKANDILSILSSSGVPNFYGPQRFGVEGKNIETAKSILAGNRPNLDKRLLRLLVSSYQSHLFNRVLESRLDDFDVLWPGDLAWHFGRVFKVDELTEELASRLSSFEISPTGPIFGYKMPQPGGREAELEGRVLEEEGLKLDSFKMKSLRFRGTRRPFRVQLKNLQLSFEENSLRVKFVLPSGSYATTVLAELMKAETQ